jgi:CheY-like chemotaxis protein
MNMSISCNQSCRVLLAEDDEIDVMLLKRAFREVNVHTDVHACSNGDEVLSYLTGRGEYGDRQKYPLPQLLLLDLKMPFKNGFEVLEWLRTDPILRKLPVVIMTSSKLTRDINRAYELGASSYFVKSTDPEKLVQVVKIIEEYWCEHAEKPILPGQFVITTE